MVLAQQLPMMVMSNAGFWPGLAIVRVIGDPGLPMNEISKMLAQVLRRLAVDRHNLVAGEKS